MTEATSWPRPNCIWNNFRIPQPLKPHSWPCPTCIWNNFQITQPSRSYNCERRKYSIQIVFKIDSKHPLKYIMTWFKFAVGTFYIFVKWVSSSRPSMYSFQINCLVLLGSSYFLLDNSYVAYAKLHFTFFRWSCRMMPSTVYYIWKQLGTGIGYTVPGDTALYPAVPKIPGTYRAQHCGGTHIQNETITFNGEQGAAGWLGCIDLS